MKHPIKPMDGSRYFLLSVGAHTDVVRADILGIFDMDTATVSPVTKQYLHGAQASGKLESAADALPKSFVVTAKARRPHFEKQEADGERVYLSQYAPSTLAQRSTAIASIGDERN